jgi:hypothetical protein
MYSDDDTCPGCGKILYPTHSLRPRPSLDSPARALLALTFLISGAIYVVGIIGIVFFLPLTVQETVLVAAFWFGVPAAIAFVIGRIAYQYPKVLRHRCRLCGWASCVPIQAEFPRG